MDDDTRSPSDTGKPPSTFEEIAVAAGCRLERVDDTGDRITAWLDALSRWLPANN